MCANPVAQVAGALGEDVREVAESCSAQVEVVRREMAAIAEDKADRVSDREGEGWGVQQGKLLNVRWVGCMGHSVSGWASTLPF